jgi:hypothetical protein
MSYMALNRDFWIVELQRHSFLTSTLDGRLSASHPGRFTRGERAPGTHWIGGWVGSRAGLDAAEKRNAYDCRESEPGRPARSLITILTELP